MYGGGGVFGTQNTKVTCILLYNKGGCLYFIPNHKSINGTFVHTFHKKIIKITKKCQISIVQEIFKIAQLLVVFTMF